MKIGTLIQCGLSGVGGFIAYFLGGYDSLLQTMLTLTILDFITGTGASIYNGEFKPRKSARGTIRKIYMYLTVALAVVIQRFMGDSIPIRETVIVFYIIAEGMSNLENIGKVIDYPEKLKEIFESLKNKV